MYEHRSHPPLSRLRFLLRFLQHVAAALALLLLSLGAGMLGYARFEQLPWLDAFLNAAMLMGGMGPVDAPKTDAGKLFAGVYALYAGLVFLIAVGVMLTPIVHRLLHRFHWDRQA